MSPLQVGRFFGEVDGSVMASLIKMGMYKKYDWVTWNLFWLRFFMLRRKQDFNCWAWKHVWVVLNSCWKHKTGDVKDLLFSLTTFLKLMCSVFAECRCSTTRRCVRTVIITPAAAIVCSAWVSAPHTSVTHSARVTTVTASVEESNQHALFSTLYSFISEANVLLLTPPHLAAENRYSHFSHYFSWVLFLTCSTTIRRHVGLLNFLSFSPCSRFTSWQRWWDGSSPTRSCKSAAAFIFRGLMGAEGGKTEFDPGCDGDMRHVSICPASGSPKHFLISIFPCQHFSRWTRRCSCCSGVSLSWLKYWINSPYV